MKRITFYIGLIVIAVIAVNLKIGAIKEKRAMPTISIANEFDKYGKPVEVLDITQKTMIFSERLTGKVTGNKITLYVGQNNWKKISKGQQAALIDKDQSLDLVVVNKSSVPNTETGLYRIDVQSANGALGLKPQSVVVDIVTKKIDNLISLPSAAIKTDDKNNKYLWVLDTENRAHKRPVETGLISLYETQIKSGLSSGDRVVLRGASSLQDKVQVRIAKTGDEK